jgi:drug/metabolite transporter (DMT)-like permease
VLTMIAVTLMWSIAGVVARQLQGAESFEITFWRSAFNALALIAVLAWLRGPGALWRRLRSGGSVLWLSGLCWAVMFTAFMVALTLTTVANVLVTMALAPLFTALLARTILRRPLPVRTWVAVALAGAGIVWMQGRPVATGDVQHMLGTALALAVPVAAALNWTLLQWVQQTRQPGAARLVAEGPNPAGALGSAPSDTSAPEASAAPSAPGGHDAGAPDMLPAVLIGALISAAATLPLAWPLAATPQDLGWLGLLGVVQLAVPCLLVVVVARVLPAPELSLLSLLEVIFGVLWAWLGAGEVPGASVLAGGALVLGALAGHEGVALWQARRGRSGRLQGPASSG